MNTWTDKTLAEAVRVACARAGVLKVTWDGDSPRRLAKSNPEMMLTHLTQYTPGRASADGRAETADLIKSLHLQPAQDLIKQHFAAAKDHAPERAATVNAERYIGNHLTLSNPRGDILRKGAAPLTTVLDAIKAIQSRGPRRMAKGAAFPLQSSNAHWDDERADDGADLAHDATDAERQRAGTRPKPVQMAPPHSASIRVGRPPPEDEDVTVAAIKEAHRNPRPLWG